MEISKIKLELYDLAAIILPGIFLLAEFEATLNGFHALLAHLKAIHAAELTLLLLCAFAFGNLVQEAADWLVKRLRGDRYLKQARDAVWRSHRKKEICDKIKRLGGPDVCESDTAFDFCLTSISGAFPKRDVFLAISDLSRSIWLLSLLAIIPVVRSQLGTAADWKTALRFTAGPVAIIAVCSWLSWKRMVRFRALSETPVFNAFLVVPEKRDNVNTRGGDESHRTSH